MHAPPAFVTCQQSPCWAAAMRSQAASRRRAASRWAPTRSSVSYGAITVGEHYPLHTTNRCCVPWWWFRRSTARRASCGTVTSSAQDMITWSGRPRRDATARLRRRLRKTGRTNWRHAVSTEACIADLMPTHLLAPTACSLSTATTRSWPTRRQVAWLLTTTTTCCSTCDLSRSSCDACHCVVCVCARA
jgi:hypothetical protein